MALLIKKITPNSLAEEIGLKAGDEIIAVNGAHIWDFMDLEYYCADWELEFWYQKKDGCHVKTIMHRSTSKALGIEPEDYVQHTCKNKCVFCFIDQMPPKMRSTLYVKDDDYLYSFIHGNYITLTNLTESEYRRIYRQHITPLYISLHTTDNDLRQKMMRSAQPLDIMRALKRLARNGIEYHLQIVCVPGYNDGEELKKTIKAIRKAKLPALSIGVVPVGLTKFRKSLQSLQGFDSASATSTLDLLLSLRTELSCGIIYPADEFFVLANREIPEDAFYQDYPQLENGIGMMRLSMENFESKKRALLKELRKKPGNYLLLCSISAEAMLCSIAEKLNKRLENQKIRVQSIRNDFFGEMITVAGLLTFEDIAKQTKPEENENLILPNSIFNYDGITLDGVGYQELKQHFKREILSIDPLFEDWDWL